MAPRRSTLGRLFDGIARRRVSPTETAGVGGTAIYSGYVQPVEQNSELVGRERFRQFSNVLANTAIVSAGVRLTLNLVGKAGWRVEPREDSGSQGEEHARLLDEILRDMETPWHRVVRRAALYKFYGFSVQEWTAKRRADGVIGLLDIEPRPQVTIERWDVDESGTLQGMVQLSPQSQEEIYLPRAKVLYLVDDVLNDSPEGLGLFRHMHETARKLRRYEQLEGYAYETDLRGVPIGRAPFAELAKMVKAGDITAAQKDALESSLRQFIQNHVKNPEQGVLLDSRTYISKDEAQSPSNIRHWDLELLKGSALPLAEVAQAIERLNRELARILGVEQLLLGSDSRGSHALSSDKSRNLWLNIDSIMQEMTEVVERDVRDPLWALNGWPDETKPDMKTEQIRHQDVEAVTAALADMAQAGAPLEPDDEAINDVRDMLGISKVDLEKAMLAQMARDQAAAALAVSTGGPEARGDKPTPDGEMPERDTGEEGEE